MMTSMVFEDALPAIDKVTYSFASSVFFQLIIEHLSFLLVQEYDHPMVKNIVHQLIAEEMGSSTQYFTSSDLSLPNEVDTYLCEKYPHLWGNTRITQSMMKIEEIAHHVSSIRVKDVSDYQSIEAVEASQQQDPQVNLP